MFGVAATLLNNCALEFPRHADSYRVEREMEMGSKLTIIVTCTAGKTGLPTPELRARSLPDATLPERADIWNVRLASAVDKQPLESLYKGQQWTSSRQLSRTARSRGFDVSLLVASAGLGLRPVTGQAPSYGATFARGDADSVASTSLEARQWWASLDHHEDLVGAVESSGRALLVLSDIYADALHDDLVRLSRVGLDVLLVGGSRPVDGLERLAPRLDLRSALGGSATSLNTRMAMRWLELLEPSEHLSASRAHRAFDDWAREVAVVERYDRAPMSDDEVRSEVRMLLTGDPSISASRALRQLRDSGRACEQKRFHRLFEQERAS
jgi:hypothetical protein